MRGARARTRAASQLLACLFACAAVAAAGQLTPEQTQGRQVYRLGTSPSGGQVTARLGGGSDRVRADAADDEVPAAALPCVNCHRPDGRGRREGGVVPSNITWEALTRPYGVVHPSGRKHPPYTAASLATAITSGVDPAGNALGAVMPRYRMPPEDLAALIAYVQRLGHDPDPGLSEAAVRIGVILPPSSAPARMHIAIRTALDDWFGAANRQGGVFGRRLDPVFFTLPEEGEGVTDAIRRFVEEQQPFALAATVPVSLAVRLGGDTVKSQTLSSLVRELALPVVVPFTVDTPPAGAELQRYQFALHAGVRDQAMALALFAGRRPRSELALPDAPRVAILVEDHWDEGAQQRIVADVTTQLERTGWSVESPKGVPTRGRVVIGGGPATIMRGLQERKVDAILSLLPSRDTEAFLATAASIGWTPITFVPGSLVGAEVLDAPRAFDSRIFAAYPSLPSGQSRLGLAQESAVATMAILGEGLRRAGREASRETVVDALETLDRFETGVTRPVTYRPNRRTGTQGAFIVRIDLERKTLVPVGEWIEVPE
jgi:ABC-type branched-subunit amino acid transport system substrate-binding protein